MKGTWADHEVRNKYYADRARYKKHRETRSTEREQQPLAKPSYYNIKLYSLEEGETNPNIDILHEITSSMNYYTRSRASGSPYISPVFEVYNKQYEKLHAKKNKTTKDIKEETELLEKILKRVKYDNEDDPPCCCCWNITKIMGSIIFIDIPTAIGLSIGYRVGEWKDWLIGSNNMQFVTNIVPIDSGVASSKQISQNDAPSTSSGFKHLGYTSWGKAIELAWEDKVAGIMYEQMLATSIRFKVNNNYVVKIEQFRSVSLPDKVNLDVTYKIQLVCSNPDGSKMSAKGAAYLEINYDQNGKIEKVTVPNTPKLSSNPTWPVLTVYHGKVCSLPVSSGTYNWLVQKIQENHGDIVIGHTEDYHLDYLDT